MKMNYIDTKMPLWLIMLDYVLLFIMLPFDYLMVFINPREWVKKPEFLDFLSYDDMMKTKKEKEELEDIADKIKYGVTKKEGELDALLGGYPKNPKNVEDWLMSDGF